MQIEDYNPQFQTPSTPNIEEDVAARKQPDEVANR